jgi:DNA-binding MarR family transcriptional regulator
LTTAEDRAEEERIRKTAQRYTDNLPWLSSTAIETHISLIHTLRVHSVAIERYLSALGLPKPISSARHTVLRTLFFEDGHRLSQNDLSREVGVSRTNITNLIDGLERDGFVARQVNPTDRRANYVELTEAGLDFCSTFIPAVAEFMAEVFSDLREGELEQLGDMLARVREGMYRRYLTDDTKADEQEPESI